MIPKSEDESKLSLSKMGSLQLEKSEKISCTDETNSPIIPIPGIINEPMILYVSPLTINPNIKTLTFVLVFIGCALIVGGFVVCIMTGHPGKGIVFWASGALVLIPGIYNLWNLIVLWKMKNKKNRVESVKQWT